MPKVWHQGAGCKASLHRRPLPPLLSLEGNEVIILQELYSLESMGPYTQGFSLLRRRSECSKEHVTSCIHGLGGRHMVSASIHAVVQGLLHVHFLPQLLHVHLVHLEQVVDIQTVLIDHAVVLLGASNCLACTWQVSSGVCDHAWHLRAHCGHASLCINTEF
jgi:predicted transcriptional regulator with HTH domain